MAHPTNTGTIRRQTKATNGGQKVQWYKYAGERTCTTTKPQEKFFCRETESVNGGVSQTLPYPIILPRE